MSEALVSAHGIHSYYGQSHILHGIDFTISRGETVGLMGRNGMGKSTLIKSLVGVVRPREGEVFVKGRSGKSMPTYKVARMGIAYVPEGRGIFPNLSVKENLLLGARPGSDGRLDWTYDRVLDSFPRLRERLTNGGAQLSGGSNKC